MNKYLFNLLLSTFLILICQSIAAKDSAKVTDKYQEIIWEQLIPEDDLKILLNPPESIWEIEDGSMEDTLESIVEPKSKNDEKVRTDTVEELRYKAALKSFNVVKSFDNKNIRLPGFMVPLVTNEQNKVTEFFIVPYFGACLHMPPPPPNQIVFATLKQGYELASIRQAFWFEGKVSIHTHNNDLGDSAYRLEVHTITEFDPFAEFGNPESEQQEAAEQQR